MSLWRRLRDAFRPAAKRPTDPVVAPRVSAAASDARSARPPVPREDDAQRIYTYVRRIGPLDERPERCDPEILAALARLWQSGQEGQAVSLGGALASALPHDARLQLAVAERLCMQRDYRQAEPLLQRVLSAEAEREPRLRARFLLHEAALDADAAATALDHLTELLAEDFFYPGARTRLAAVQARLVPGTDGPPALAGLLPLGVDGGLAVPAAPTVVGLPGAAQARYKLLRELGCGGTGTVYLALDTELGCELALKVFHPHSGSTNSADGAGNADNGLLRALHEARLLAAVRHPGVITLYDIGGELPDQPGSPSGGPPRLAMELCRGGSLRARLRAGPLPLPAALQRAAELFDTLDAVHRAGIVHGDIKPENLLFRGPGVHRGELPPAEAALGDLVVSDFGLARLCGKQETPGRGLGGTPGYLAPERLSGAAASPASDLYAAAVVLWEMLSGELPPARRAVLPGRSPLPAERWAALAAPLGKAGPDLRALLEACLLPDPAARPTAAVALTQLTALRAAVPQEPMAANG